MYLMAHNPDLGITDPYELTQEQLDAAIALLKAQQPNISKYWALYTDEIDGFNDGSMVVGTAWPVNLTYTKDDAPAAARDPLRRGDRLGRHLDDLGQRPAPELHAQVDGVVDDGPRCRPQVGDLLRSRGRATRSPAT